MSFAPAAPMGCGPLAVPGRAQLSPLQRQEPGLSPPGQLQQGAMDCSRTERRQHPPSAVHADIEQIHPWDISFGFGWAAPAGTPNYERLNRVSK